MELITSDEMATFVKYAINDRNKDFFIDGEADEYFEVTSVQQEGSVLTVTATNVSRTRSLTFTIGVA